MIKNLRLYVLVIMAILIQGLFISNSNILGSQFPFLDGVPYTSSTVTKYQYLIYWYFPIIVMGFYFSGSLRDMIRFRGIAYFTRNYSKGIWIIKQYGTILIIVCQFVFFQYVLFSCLKVGTYEIGGITLIKSLLIYIFSLSLLFCIQVFLELYIRPEISHIIVNLYIVIPLLVPIKIQGISADLNYIFVANYGMGFRNGLNEIAQFKIQMIDYSSGVFILIFVQILITIISVKKVKKIDVL